MSTVTIERIDVGERCLEALVRVPEASMRTASAAPGLRRRCEELLPGLDRHSCRNDAGKRFADESEDTETAHLLEHVACELMALAGSPRSLQGETAWDFTRDGRGVFLVRLEFDDDVVALGALKEAVKVVEWLLTGLSPRPDVDAAVERLRNTRG